MSKKVDKELGPSKKVKKGVGGWLLLFVIILTIIIPILDLIGLQDSLSLIFLYQLLPEKGLFIFEIIEMILSIGLICFSIYAGVSLWRVKPNAVKIAKIFLITDLINSIIILIITPVLLPLPLEVSEKNLLIRTFTFWFGFFIIWFCYLTKSKRVKATYGKESFKKKVTISNEKWDTEELLMEILPEGEYKEEFFEKYVEEGWPKGRKITAERHMHKMWFGGILFFIGTILTLVGYSTAISSPGGGEYYIYYGMIGYGIWELIKGFLGWREYKD